MKELIPMNDYGIFADNKDMARANSLIVAEMFGKRHTHVLRDIEKLTEPKSGLSEEFKKMNFQTSSYKDASGRKVKCYNLTRDGFTMLVMGYTGINALKFKEAYIKQFNEMEKFIQKVISVRKDYPLLTDAVKMAHEHPQPYHFSNEADLLNKIIVGCTAKEFRAKNNIPKGESIRPYLSDEQIELMEVLQKVDTGLLIAVPDYQQRKRHLEWYAGQYKTKLVSA